MQTYCGGICFFVGDPDDDEDKIMSSHCVQGNILYKKGSAKQSIQDQLISRRVFQKKSCPGNTWRIGSPGTQSEESHVNYVNIWTLMNILFTQVRRWRRQEVIN